MFTALEGLAGMGAGSSRSRTPTVASVLNLNSLNAPTCTALRAGGPLLSWRTPDAQAPRACGFHVPGARYFLRGLRKPLSPWVGSWPCYGQCPRP